jgi:hypothetical protein
MDGKRMVDKIRLRLMDFHNIQEDKAHKPKGVEINDRF